MKKSFSRILSAILSCSMILGMISLLFIGSVFSASAEETEIRANEDFTYNGITYRLDVYSGNTESYAKVNADGSVEFKIRHGDMIWFPGLTLTDSSAIHAEVTSVSATTNIFSGLTYGVKPNESGTWASGMCAVVKTAARVRVTSITYSNLGNINGGDRGNGGDTRALDTALTTDEKATDAYKKLADSGNDWARNTTLSFDVSRDGNTVSVTWGAAGVGDVSTKTYDTSSNAVYQYTDGSVGFAPVWAGTDNYLTLRFDNLEVTNCKVNGEETALFSFGERKKADVPGQLPYKMEKNTEIVIDGVRIRFDSYNGLSDSGGAGGNHNGKDTYVIINADGTITARLAEGDLLWFPDVKVDTTSKIVSDVVLTDTNCGGNHITDYSELSGFGPAWNITMNGSMWATEENCKNDTLMIAATRAVNDIASTDEYLSVAKISAWDARAAWSYNAAKVGLADTKLISGKFGDRIGYNTTDNRWDESLKTTVTFSDGIKAVADDGDGKTVATAVYQGGDAATLSAGAVGFFCCFGKWDSVYEYTIRTFTVENATVNGAETKSDFSIAGFVGKTVVENKVEPVVEEEEDPGDGRIIIPKKTDFTYHDQVFYFESTQGKAYIKDGKLNLQMKNGDAFYIKSLTLAPDWSTKFKFSGVETTTTAVEDRIAIACCMNGDYDTMGSTPYYWASHVYAYNIFTYPLNDAAGARTTVRSYDFCDYASATDGAKAEACGTVNLMKQFMPGNVQDMEFLGASLEPASFGEYTAQFGFTIDGADAGKAGFQIGSEPREAKGNFGLVCFCDTLNTNITVEEITATGAMMGDETVNYKETFEDTGFYTEKLAVAHMTVDGKTKTYEIANTFAVETLVPESKTFLYATVNGEVKYAGEIITPANNTVIQTYTFDNEAVATAKVAADGTTGLKWTTSIGKAAFDALKADAKISDIKVGTFVTEWANITDTSALDQNMDPAKLTVLTADAEKMVADGDNYKFEGIRTVAKAERETVYAGIGFLSFRVGGKTVYVLAPYSARQHAYALNELVDKFPADEEEETTGETEQNTEKATGAETTGTETESKTEAETEEGKKSGCGSAVASAFALIAVAALGGAVACKKCR